MRNDHKLASVSPCVASSRVPHRLFSRLQHSPVKNREMYQCPIPIPKSPHIPNTSRFDNSFNDNHHSFNTNNITVTDAWSGVLAQPCPTEPRFRNFTLGTHRVEGVGNWLLWTEQFRTWRSLNGQCELQKPILFCDGDPGVGKTHIW